MSPGQAVVPILEIENYSLPRGRKGDGEKGVGGRGRKGEGEGGDRGISQYFQRRKKASAFMKRYVA